MQSALAAELKNDPEGLGYSAHLPDDPQRVLDLLTQQTTTMIGPLRSTTAKVWAANGIYEKIFDASMTQGHPCRSSCLIIRETFACGDPIHLEDPRLQGMLTAWISGEIVTEEEVNALYALATVTVSRAEKLGISSLTNRQILDAWSEQ